MAEKLTKEKYTELVLALAGKGMTSERIGIEIKKEHKITPRSIEKISKILKNSDIKIQPDMENLKISIQTLEKHGSQHRQDNTYKRSLTIKKAKLRKLQSL